jgi:hypothetical protein
MFSNIPYSVLTQQKHSWKQIALTSRNILYENKKGILVCLSAPATYDLGIETTFFT